MNVVENEVRELVEKELAAANERFQAFASAHEGYAVILEGLEEANEDAKFCELYVNQIWYFVKADTNADERASALYRSAVKCACEMIQLAAMSKKFIGTGASS